VLKLDVLEITSGGMAQNVWSILHAQLGLVLFHINIQTRIVPKFVMIGRMDMYVLHIEMCQPVRTMSQVIVAQIVCVMIGWNVPRTRIIFFTNSETNALNVWTGM